VVGDAVEDIREPGLRVDAVELGGLDQAMRGRTMRFTMKRPGTYSSSSVTSSPSILSLPPHLLQASPGDSTSVWRGSSAGSGLRFGLALGSLASAGAGVSAFAAAISSSSRRNRS